MTYNGPPLQWLHFYGADPSVRLGSQAARFTTRFPNFGSAYRGSCLCSMRVIKYPNGKEFAHKKKILYDLPESFHPPAAKYLLRVLVYQGSDFGSTGPEARGKGLYYSLGVSIGPHSVRTAFRRYADGSVNWVEILEGIDLPLPNQLSMLPDTFITVYCGTEATHFPVAFHRLKTLTFMPGGLSNAPEWYQLQHDMSHKSKPPATFPGCVLLKMALINVQDIDVSCHKFMFIPPIARCV